MLRRKRVLATIVMTLGLTPWAAAYAARLPADPPEIFAIDPAEAPAGSTVKVTGKGFERMRYVLFAAGRTGQQAKFKVVSDRVLDVTAPPYLKDGTSATVVVVTWSGAAVGVPASVLEVDSYRHGGAKTANFYHVLEGGVLGASVEVVVVDEGGTATASDKSAICFVKNGGTLKNTDHFSGLVIHERDAIFETSPQPNNPLTRLLQVPVIMTSPGVAPFVYLRAESPELRAQTPPRVSSLGPRIVPMDGIVTLKGTGFSETSEVLFVGDGAKHESSADFRVVSDEELQLQVPDRLIATARLLIRNPKGATLVVARDDVAAHPERPPRTTPAGRVSVRNRSTRGRTSTNPFIGQSQPAAWLANAQPVVDRDVESISLSVVPAMFTIVPP
jgi:hypothetical protein